MALELITTVYPRNFDVNDPFVRIYKNVESGDYLGRPSVNGIYHDELAFFAWDYDAAISAANNIIADWI